MADQIVMKTEPVQAWAVQPTADGSQTAIVFKVRTGTAAFSFAPDDFDRFAGKTISEAGKLVEGRASATTPQTTDAPPIPMNLLSIEAHPDDQSSALLAVEVGKLRLVFAMDVNMLLRSCKQFLEQRRSLRDGGAT
jgi:hypothetical protein